MLKNWVTLLINMAIKLISLASVDLMPLCPRTNTFIFCITLTCLQCNTFLHLHFCRLCTPRTRTYRSTSMLRSQTLTLGHAAPAITSISLSVAMNPPYQTSCQRPMQVQESRNCVQTKCVALKNSTLSGKNDLRKKFSLKDRYGS